MTPNEVEAIIGGYHGDPFRILGPHRVKRGWVIRAFLPQASDVFLLLNGHRLVATQAEATLAMFAAAAGELDEAAFAAWLRSHLQPRA